SAYNSLRNLQGLHDLGRTALFTAAALRGGHSPHRLCGVAASVRQHKFSGKFYLVTEVARHGIATPGYYVPQPWRAAAPAHVGRLRLEPDHTRPGAAR